MKVTFGPVGEGIDFQYAYATTVNTRMITNVATRIFLDRVTKSLFK